MHNLVCSFMVNVSPFITDIFPDQLSTDLIADQRHEGKICLPVLSQQVARLYGLVNGMASANVITYSCPDKGKVVYEIRRDPNHWWKDPLSPLTEAEVKPYVP